MAFWDELGIPVSKKASFNLYVFDWIRTNCMGYETVSANIPWSIMFPYALFILWKQRNSAIFDPGKRISNPVGLVISMAAEVMSSVHSATRNDKKIYQVKWTPPLEGWSKLNTDVSGLGSPEQVGIGGVLRDNSGNWIRGFCGPIGHSNSLIAELFAVRQGLKLAKELGIRDLIVEMDAKAVLDLIWGSANSNLFLMPVILDCRVLSRGFNRFQTMHTFREGNAVADALARMGSGMNRLGEQLNMHAVINHFGADLYYSHPGNLLLFEFPPRNTLDAFRADRLGVTIPRLVRNIPADMVGD